MEVDYVRVYKKGNPSRTVKSDGKQRVRKADQPLVFDALGRKLIAGTAHSSLEFYKEDAGVVRKKTGKFR